MEDDLNRVREYIENQKDLFLEELKNRITTICQKHDIVFDSGMGGYSFQYLDKYRYYFDDYVSSCSKIKDLNKIEEEFIFDLEHSEDEYNTLYFKEELRKIQKVKEFHQDVVELENFAKEIEKVLKFGSNPITWVSIKD